MVSLPEDTLADDLALSEVQTLATVWWEMHRPFFNPLVELFQVAATAPRGSDTPSTAASYAALKEAMRTAGATPGTSSSGSST